LPWAGPREGFGFLGERAVVEVAEGAILAIIPGDEATA
jgi:hypothetical protein